MFSTDFIFKQENLVDNQKRHAGFRPLRNKILFPRPIFDLQTASNCCLLQFFNASFIAFQNLTYVQNPSYPTAESGSTAMSCVYVVNAVASAPGKNKSMPKL